MYTDSLQIDNDVKPKTVEPERGLLHQKKGLKRYVRPTRTLVIPFKRNAILSIILLNEIMSLGFPAYRRSVASKINHIKRNTTGQMKRCQHFENNLKCLIRTGVRNLTFVFIQNQRPIFFKEGSFRIKIKSKKKLVGTICTSLPGNFYAFFYNTLLISAQKVSQV